LVAVGARAVAEPRDRGERARAGQESELQHFAAAEPRLDDLLPRPERRSANPRPPRVRAAHRETPLLAGPMRTHPVGGICFAPMRPDGDELCKWDIRKLADHGSGTATIPLESTSHRTDATSRAMRMRYETHARRAVAGPAPM